MIILLKKNSFTSLVIRFRIMKHCYWKRMNSRHALVGLSELTSAVLLITTSR